MFFSVFFFFFLLFIYIYIEGIIVIFYMDLQVFLLHRGDFLHLGPY